MPTAGRVRDSGQCGGSWRAVTLAANDRPAALAEWPLKER